MRETVLIILAAVVATIVMVVLLGMRYLRADDDDDDFDDDIPAQRGRGRRGEESHDRPRSRGHDDRREDHPRQRQGAERDRYATSRPGHDRQGSGRPASDRSGPDRPGSDRPASDRHSSPDRRRADRPGSADRHNFGRRSPDRNDPDRHEPARGRPSRADDRRDEDRRVPSRRGDDQDWPGDADRAGRSGREPLPQRARSASRRDGDDLAAAAGRPGPGSSGRDDRRGPDDFDSRPGQFAAPGRDYDRRGRADDSDGGFRRDRADSSEWRDGRAAASVREAAGGRDDRDRTAVTRPGTRPEGRRPAAGQADPDDSLPSVKPRQNRAKRDSEGDWPSTEWDELSDVDYWAELASDKPLTTSGPATGPQAAHGARPEARKGADAGSRADRGSADRASGDRPSGERMPAAHRPADRSSGERPVPDRTLADRPERDVARTAAIRSARQHDPGSEAGRVPAAPGLGSQETSLRGRRDEFASGPRRAASISAEHALPLAAAMAPSPVPAQPDDDDPLTSPSFPRIEADDSRSYRRSRPSASGTDSLSRLDAASSQGPTQQYSVPPLLPPVPQAGGLGDASLSHSRPAPLGADFGNGAGHAAASADDPYRQLSSPGYPAAGGTGSYQVPSASGPYPGPASTGSYPMPPASQPGGYRPDDYLQAGPDSGSYPVPMTPPGSYSADPGLSRYPVDQTIASPGYGSVSGQHRRPEPGYDYASGYSSGPGYADGADQAFGGRGTDSYPSYPTPPSPISGPQPAVSAQLPGVARSASGYGEYAEYSVPAAQPGYQDGQYQPYEPPGYSPAPQESGGYAGADPYAMDPYGYSGYGNGGY